MVVKMGLILKQEKQSVLSSLFYCIILLLYIIFSSEFIILFGVSLISMVLSLIPSYFVIKQTNTWMKGYHELKAWGDLLDKYEILPKQKYVALLDKDINNLEILNDE